MYQIKRSIKLPVSIDVAWQFFSDPRNLSIITPPKLNMVITSELPERMYQGMIISYKIHPFFSLPLTWVTEITHVLDRTMFVDEQRYGPYRLWHHQHFFDEVEGGVEVQDLVTYIMPFGPLGQLVHMMQVGKQLRDIFDYRSRVLIEKFGAL